MNTRNMLNRFVTGMIIVAAALVWCGTAQAQTNFYWTNTASSLWSTNANWTNGYPSQYGCTNVILNFNVAGTYTSSNNWTGIFTNNSLVFAAGTVTLAGGQIAFKNNGATLPVVTNYSGNLATISNALAMATNVTFTGPNDITVAGVISGAGSSSLIKDGAGTLTLSGANNYTGATIVKGGTLTVKSSTDKSSSLSIDAGATVNVGGGVINRLPSCGNNWTISGTLTKTDGFSDDITNSVTLNNGTLSSTADNSNGWGSFNMKGGTITANGANNTISAQSLGIDTGFTNTFNTPNATDALTISSILGASQAGSKGGVLAKTGAGTLTLSGTNIVTGPTTISAGTLAISGAGQLNSGAYAAAISNNGVFVYNSSAAQTLSGVISGNGSLIKTNTSTLTLSGNNTLGGGVTLNNGTLVISGSLSGNGGVTVNGGFLTNSVVNTYSGATWVNAGRFVEITGSSCSNSALYLADGATNSVSVVAGGAWSCASLTCTGGTTTLDFDFGSLQDTMAPLNVIGGLYVTGTVNVVVRNGDWPATGTYPLVKYGVNGVGPGSFALTLPSGVSATLNNNTGSKQLELNVTTVPLYTSQPTSVWTNKANGAWSTSTCWTNSIPDGTNVVADFSKANVNADLYVNVDSARTIGTLVYNNTNAKNLYVTNSPVTLATTSGIPAIIVSNQAVIIGSTLQGTQGFIKYGAGTGILAATVGNYTGDTVIKAGTLTIGNNGSATAYYYTNGIFYLGDPTLGANATLRLNLNQSATASGYFNQIVVASGAGTRTISGSGYTSGDNRLYATGGITLGSSGVAQDLSIVADLNNVYFAVYASIGDPAGLSGLGGTVTFNSSPGALRVSGANTYSGDTRLKSGTVYINHAQALQNSTLDMNASDSGTPSFGASCTLGGLKGAVSRNVPMAAYTLTIGNNNQPTIYSGVLSSTGGGVIKTGYGTLTLAGANTYTGGTTVNAGFIGVSNNLAMSTGLVTLSGGGIAGAAGTWAITNVINLSSSAKFDTTGSLALMGPVTNSGALRKIGAGTLTLSGTNTYTGGTTVSNGTLIVNGSVTGAVTVVAGSTLGGTGVVAGVVTNNGTITAGDITTNGTLTVTNLVMGEYSTYVWNCNNLNSDVVVVNGSLTLPNVATVTVSQATGRIPNPGVLFTGFSSVNTSNLTGWVINGAQSNCKAQVVGNQVLLVSPKGWVMSVE